MTAAEPHALCTALALAVGRKVDASAVEHWEHVHEAARAERLSVLAWSRSGSQIRRYAPPGLVARWRAEAVAAHELAARQLSALAELNAVAASARAPAVVLKGLPLAHRLYGDIGARMCCDIDLFVPESARSRMNDALRECGWEHWFGTSPFDASYRRASNGATVFLEVHSLLASETLAHCHLLPVDTRTWRLDDIVVQTLDGPVLPVYLAANLAKHGAAPLISYLDLALVWASHDQRGQHTARRLAHEAHLTRCFRWALARAEGISAAAGGDARALRLLGVSGNARTSTHAMLRLMWLSDHLTDAAHILATWTWPRSLRRSPGALLPYWKRRMGRSFHERFKYTRSYAIGHGSRD